MGQGQNLPLGGAGREPREHCDPKAEEGGNSKKVGKKGRGTAGQGPRTTILD